MRSSEVSDGSRDEGREAIRRAHPKVLNGWAMSFLCCSDEGRIRDVGDFCEVLEVSENERWRRRDVRSRNDERKGRTTRAEAQLTLNLCEFLSHIFLGVIFLSLAAF